MDPLYLPDEEVFIKKCKDYVQKIENYQGTDPLHYWYSYLLWYEDNFALNCQEHGLFFEILSQCLVCFELKNQYNDDRRFIKICTKFVSKFEVYHKIVFVYDFFPSNLLLLFLLFTRFHIKIVTTKTPMKRCMKMMLEN